MNLSSCLYSQDVSYPVDKQVTCIMTLAMAIPLQIVAPRSLVHGLLALTQASQWSYELDLIASNNHYYDNYYF